MLITIVLDDLGVFLRLLTMRPQENTGVDGLGENGVRSATFVLQNGKTCGAAKIRTFRAIFTVDLLM